MNPHPPQSPGALDAEERALAKVLPRLHGRTTPGPDVDASILAAAQAAVQLAKPASANPNRPRIRWIAPAALAASMVLAVGMAWQLRPLPALHAPQPAAADAAATEQAVQMIERAPSDKPMPMAKVQPAVVQSQQANAPAVRAEQALPRPNDQPAAAPAPLSPPPPAPPAPMAATPPAVALPAPAPAAMAAKTSSTAEFRTGALQTQAIQDASHERAAAAATANGMQREATADKSGVTASSQSAATSPARASSVVGGARNEAEMAADAGFVDAPEADIPPATAASPAVRDAWLRRISQLLEQGNRQEAKTSLAEFKRRYPNAVLPSALKALDSEP